VVEWPSGVRKIANWELDEPIKDTLTAAKEYVSVLIQERLNAGCADDVERTNVPSLIAAVQKHIGDWSDKLREHLDRRAAPVQ
jgi:hypothetical protein